MSRTTIVAVFAAALLSFVASRHGLTQAGQPAPVLPDLLQKLQGTWTIEQTETRLGGKRFAQSYDGRPATLKFRVVIKGDIWTNDFTPPLAAKPSFATDQYRISVDDSGLTDRLKLTGLDGPFKGRHHIAIVRLEGDNLHIYGTSTQSGIDGLGTSPSIAGYARFKKVAK
jgi:uncharacterized protein (TIGR03067 family)